MIIVRAVFLSFPGLALCAASFACLLAPQAPAPRNNGDSQKAKQTTPPASQATKQATSRHAKTDKDFKAYTQKISGTKFSIDLVPIRGGVFTMGSPDKEKGHKRDESPQRKVRVGSFWMAKYEMTWEIYELWALDLDREEREGQKHTSALDKKADAVTKPSKPYVDMSFGMGKDDMPAICMTQKAAITFCKWLSAKTGVKYRLPTEAEWEYACRAGTTTRYSFGDSASKLRDYAWYKVNSKDAYHKPGLKKPNPWGLYDMHGNVAEWVLDAYNEKGYPKPKTPDTVVDNPLVLPKTLYPRVVRGGSYADPTKLLRSAARMGSTEDWKMRDPQIPQSTWYHTDAPFVGFRIIRAR